MLLSCPIKSLWILFLFFQGFVIRAQLPNRPNDYGADSTKTGDWIYWYDSNWNIVNPETDDVSFYRLVTYKNGVPVGQMGDYFANGQPQMIGTLFSENPERFHGKLTFYDESGEVIRLEDWDNGVMNQRIEFIDGFISLILQNDQGENDFIESARKMDSLVLKYEKENFSNTVAYIVALGWLGYDYYRIFQYFKAEQTILKCINSLDTYIEENNLTPSDLRDFKNLKSTVYSQLANIYREMGRYEEALKLRTSHLESYDDKNIICLLYTSPSPRDRQKSRMPSSA